MAILATATTKLTADNKGLDKGLDNSIKSVKRYGEKVKATMLAVAKSIAIVGVAAGALAFNFIKAASDFEEIRGKFTAVFKDLTAEATIFVDELASSLGRSRMELTAFMATLQDTFVPLGFARKEGLEMSKTLVQLTIDLASFNNQAESDVLNALQSAIVGNVETMRKYGVIISQVALNQELLNIGIAGGVKKASEQEKALARLNIIIEGTVDAQGDAARTSESFANQMRSLNAEIENVRVELGQELLPIAKDMVGILKEMTQNSEDFLDPLFKMGIGFALLGNAIMQTLTALVLALPAGAIFGETLRDKLKELRADWILLTKQLETPLKTGLAKQVEEDLKALGIYNVSAEEAIENAERFRKLEKEFGKDLPPEILFGDKETIAAFRKSLEKAGKDRLKIKVATPEIDPFAPVMLERALRLELADIPQLDGLEDLANLSRDFESAFKPSFVSLEEAWKRVSTGTKSSDPQIIALNKVADAAEKTKENTTEMKESTKTTNTILKAVERFLMNIDEKTPVAGTFSP